MNQISKNKYLGFRSVFVGEVIDFLARQNIIENELTIDKPEDMPDIVGCMDDIEPDESCPVYGGVLYSQLGGASYGVTKDVAVMMEVARPGSFVEQNKPISVLGSVVTKLCREKEQMQLTLHHRCAALLGAGAVATTTVEFPDIVFASARDLKPDLTEERAERIIEGNKSLLASGLLVDPRTDFQKLARGDTPNAMPIPVGTLLNKPHESNGFVFDFRTGKVLDVPRANEEGLQHYYNSVGKYEQIRKALRNTLSIDTDLIMDVYAMRIGAIRAKHLTAEDGSILPAIVIPKAA
jgi:hypothetical protein